ncbi:MAG: hypothetical protein GY741_07360 [Phycisphaeraceae bacterium]|nr:hypothetical protein [Phycisphaeraceae bacterium]
MTPRRRPELRITGMLAAVTLASVLSTSMATVAEDTAPRSARAGTEDTDTSPRGSATEIRTAIEAARASMASEDWAKAADAWSEVERLDPTAAAAIYNLGVARYRDGDPQAAADAFERAARFGDADLAARSMYNEGTARYAAALETLGEDTETSDPKAMQETIERVERSLEHFKDALDADQENRDARINAELAARLIRRLEEVQQQQEQQQQGQQQQDQQQQDQQQQDQQQQDQQQQDQQKDSEQEDDAEATPSSSEASDDAEASEPRMTREEAERLLQSVRDKERQRRREKAEAEERRPKKPVERDW